MIHYTCDMCEKRLIPDKDVRYRVEITVELKSCSTDDDMDLFDEEEMIRYMLESESEEFSLPTTSEEKPYERMVFDLCSSCHKIFMRDPLFKNVRARFGFREN